MMSDVFVSYKAEDRRRVRPLVDALKADGFSVWWDAQISGGDEWRETLETELDSAKCVLVVWSKRSRGAAGRFVRDEAARAQRRGTYLPVLLDRVEPPLGFGEIQALSMVGWRNDRSDARYQAVLQCVRALSECKPPPLRTLPPSQSITRRGLIAGGATAAVALGVGTSALWLKSRSNAANGSIAVLPFANMSGDPGQSYFSDGIAEEVRTALARVPGLTVIGRVSSEMFRNASDVGAVARKLDVANIVTGSVRRSRSAIRVGAQLVEGSSGIERWSQSYDRAAGDALAIQTDIAASVADALRIRLGSGARSTLFASRTGNPQAQDLFLKAVAVRESNHTAENFREALGMFSAATKLDPRFADAYAQQASTLADLTGSYSSSAAEFQAGYNRAGELARTAIRLDRDRALGHSALADVYKGQLKIPEALSEYREAMARFAGEVEVLVGYGSMLGNIGKSSQALAALNKAIRIDPLNPRPRSALTYALFNARRYNDAINAIPSVLAMSPKRPATLSLLGNCLTLVNRLNEARSAYQQLPADELFRLTGEAILETRLGDRRKSDELLRRIRELNGGAAAYQEAEVLSQQAAVQDAVAALGRAFEVHDPGLISLPTDPFLDPIRDDPEFTKLLQTIHFPS